MTGQKENEKKRRRVTTGCLACRKRKIKCDEQKPTCGCCTRGSYICEWTTEKQTIQSLSKYVIKKTKKKHAKFINVTSSPGGRKKYKVSIKPEEHVFQIHNSPTFTPNHSLQSGFESKKDVKTTAIVLRLKSFETNKHNVTEQNYEDAQFRQYLQTLGERYKTAYNIISTQLPGMCLNMTNEELQLFDAFTNGFMVAISPQLAHENLQPSSIVIPRGLNNPTLRSLFYSCGATYLSWNRQEYRLFAETQYRKCIHAIVTMAECNLLNGDEDWLLIIMVTLCLREKYQCQDSVRNALFLIASLDIIYYWIKLKQMNSLDYHEVSIVDEIQFSECLDQLELQVKLLNILRLLENRYNSTNFNIDEFTDLENKNPHIDPSTALNLSTRDDLNLNFELTSEIEIAPFERTMIESFLYNYSVTLLNFDTSLIKYVDSPFNVFKKLAPFLTRPIYNCRVKWMNNPIMGNSLPAFELAAKANWLRLHYPLDDLNTLIAKNLRTSAKYYTSPLLPESVRLREPAGVQRKLMESCHVGNMTAVSAYILLTKLIYPNYDATSGDIKGVLDCYFSNLKELSPHSQVGGVCIWSFIICGICLTDDDQKKYLLYRMRTFGELKKSEALVRAIHFLETTWEVDENNSGSWNIIHNKHGFNALFL